MARAVNFFRVPNCRCQIRNQRPKRHKIGWCSHRIAEIWWSQLGLMMQPGPEEFVNLQGHLVQSSNLFCISSVQFRSLGVSLSGKFVQLFWSSEPSASVQFGSVQFSPLSSWTLPALTWIDLADLQGLLVQSSIWLDCNYAWFYNDDVSSNI